jgi:thiol-disulfide isomerase/thioredoxin
MKKILIGLIGALMLSGALAGSMSKNYVEYTQKAFDEAADAKTKRVLFFAASWCPSCRGADKNITENLEKIPTNVVIFKTDYDKETALKTKYGITRQHSFVYVDAKGMALKTWSGGGLNEIIEATK